MLQNILFVRARQHFVQNEQKNWNVVASFILSLPRLNDFWFQKILSWNHISDV